jgi:hypothetical protein
MSYRTGPPVFTVNGKTVNIDSVKFDLLSRDPAKGHYQTIMGDGSEIYWTAEEYKEVRRLYNEWWKRERATS